MFNKNNFIYIAGVIGYRWIDAFGINLIKMLSAIRGIVSYIKDSIIFYNSERMTEFTFQRSIPFPCLSDRFLPSGTASGAYFHQDLLVAQKIYQRQPQRHIDVGSSVAGFVAHVACFREIEVLDVRPLSVSVRNISFKQVDLMADLDKELCSCCDSLSCLHALEHFGLGRYGDPLRPDGFMAGWNNLYRILKEGGTLYFSVPLGNARIEFNAHRIFSTAQLQQLIDGKYETISFSYVDDTGSLHENQQLERNVNPENFGCHFGCAILELRKI